MTSMELMDAVLMTVGGGLLGVVLGFGLTAALRWEGSSRIAAVAVAAVIGVLTGLLFSGPGAAFASALGAPAGSPAARPADPLAAREGLPWNLDVLQARYPFEYGRIAALSRDNPAAGEIALARLTTPIYADLVRRQMPKMDNANARKALSVLGALVRKMSAGPELCAQSVNDPIALGSDPAIERQFGALAERERQLEAAILEQTALRPEQEYDPAAARALLAPLVRDAATRLSPADMQIIAAGRSGALSTEQAAAACRFQVQLMDVMSAQSDEAAARAMRAFAVVMRDGAQG